MHQIVVFLVGSICCSELLNGVAVTEEGLNSTLLVLAEDRRTPFACFGSFGRMEIANNFSFQDPTGKGN